MTAGVAEPVVGPSTPSGVSSSQPRDGGGLLDLVGDVSWEWLAGCRACGRPHSVRPDPKAGCGHITWASGEDGHAYQPRVHRWQLDALLVEYRTAQAPRDTVPRLLNPDTVIPPGHDYAVVPVAKPPGCLATPVVDSGGHRWQRGPGGVLGAFASHGQLCELCSASRTALTPPGWDGVDITWIYPEGHPVQCPGARS